MLKVDDEGTVQLTAMVYWAVWNRRNSMIWSNTCWNETQVLNSATLSLSEWKLATERTHGYTSSSVRRLKPLEMESSMIGKPEP